MAVEDQRPIWRQLFDGWEQQIAPQLEQMVRTEEFADRVAQLNQLTQRAAEATNEFTSRLWQFWNLPTASDVTKLNQRLAAIERQLKSLSKAIEGSKVGDNRRRGSGTSA